MDADQTKEISRVRFLATKIIHEITEEKAYANLALEKGLRDSDLGQIDKSLVTEIVNGTIRMLKHLDWVLNLFLTKPINKLNPWIKTILRMSLYQILFMDKIPNYASVNDAVDLAKKKTNHNLSKLVNGVLRNIIRNLNNITYPEENTAKYLSVYHSHPQWLVEGLLKDYGSQNCEQILLYNNQRPPLYLRVNTLKISRTDLINKLQDEGVICEASDLSPWAINISKLGIALDDTIAYKKGYFYIQNIASMLATSILDPKPNEIVYDLCSGVGGKSTHLAQAMNNQGAIHCYDIYKQKLDLLNKNAERLGIDIISTHLQDILELDIKEVADKVLLDVPCSGLGVLNRRADLRWNKEPEDLTDLIDLQSNLLIKASQMVKKKGYLLYATCTINKSENEEIVIRFINEFNNFELVGFKDNIAYFPLNKHNQLNAEQGMLTIIPGEYQTDGMFYALLKRKDAN